MIRLKPIYVPLLLVFTSCTTISHTATRLVVGLSLKKHKISDKEILQYPKKYFSSGVTIGKFQENYFLEMRNDSTLYNKQSSKVKSKYSNFIVQPLNCMFFDETDTLIAAYSICDADLIKAKLTWEDYLTRRHLVKNIDIAHNVTFAIVEKYIEKLEVNNSNANAKNVVLCWSKVGGRQTKNYFREFADFLSKKKYNIYIVNCDEAINKLPVSTSQK